MKFPERFKRALVSDSGLREIIGYLNKLSETELMECLAHYLTAFVPESKPLDQRALNHGQVVGRNIFGRAIDLANPLNTLLDLVPPAKAYAIYDPCWKRLSDDDRRNLTQRATIKRREIRERTTALTPLIKAFIEKYPDKPLTIGMLYAFDPAPNPKLHKEFETIAVACAQSWQRFIPQNRQNVAPSTKALDELDAEFKKYQDFLIRNEKDPLVLFQILKWIRAGNASRALPWSSIWDEFYLSATQHLLRMAKIRDLPADDAPFFRLAHKPRVDQEIYLARLTFGLRNVTGFLEVTRARRRHDRFARYWSIQLVDEFAEVKLLNRIDAETKANPAAIKKRFIQVESKQLAFNDKHRVGQNIMEYFTIVWIEGDQVYVEFHHFDCVLFRADAGRLEALIKQAFYKALARNAAALTAFLLAYLEVIGLVIDVISAGSAGGIRRFIWELAKERIKEKMTDAALDVAGVDNKAVRTAAGIGVNFLHLPKGSNVDGGGLNVDAQRAGALADRPGATATRQATDASPRLDADGVPVAGQPAKVDRPTAGAQAVDVQKEAQRRAADNDIIDLRQKMLERKQQVVVVERKDAIAVGAGRRGGGSTLDPPRGVDIRQQDVRSGGGGGGNRGGGGNSGGGGGGGPKRPVETVPEPHPYTERPVTEYDTNWLRTFFFFNKKKYPPHIQDMINDLPKRGSRRELEHAPYKRIDKAIKDEHTRTANQMAGYGNAAKKPFINSVRSGSNEGNRTAALLNDGKGLTLIGQTKGGLRDVEFDAVGFQSRRLVETKLSIPNDKDPLDQMRKQAEFARDWGFRVRWDVYDHDSWKVAAFSWNRLQRSDPDLARYIEDVVNPTQPGRVIDDLNDLY